MRGLGESERDGLWWEVVDAVYAVGVKEVWRWVKDGMNCGSGGVSSATAEGVEGQAAVVGGPWRQYTVAWTRSSLVASKRRSSLLRQPIPTLLALFKLFTQSVDRVSTRA